MANPPKQKGTRFESDLVSRAHDFGLDAYRMPASSRYDIQVRGNTGRNLDALITRPDYGQALVTIRLADFFHLLAEHGDGAHIEAKRYKAFRHHSIFEDKFA